MAKAEWVQTSPSKGSGNGTVDVTSKTSYTGRIARTKDLIKKYRRRRILRDIKKAKRYYEEGKLGYMCLSFMAVATKYRKKPIDSIIPEFNRDFLNAKYKECAIWWEGGDRESRIKAFDKLIEVYS